MSAGIRSWKCVCQVDDMVIHASLITKHQGVPKTSLETRQKILFTGRMQ